MRHRPFQPKLGYVNRLRRPSNTEASQLKNETNIRPRVPDIIRTSRTLVRGADI